MATWVPSRYRRLDTLRCAAAYLDGRGDILAANEAFRDLWRTCLGDDVRVEGSALLTIVGDGDRESLRVTLSAREPLAARVPRPVRLAGPGPTALTELVPIRRRANSGVVWLVTLRSPHPARQVPGPEALRAAVTAGVVHDLRAPLHVMLGWTSLLRQHNEPERIERALTAIERNARLEMDLVEDLLDTLRPSWTRPTRRLQSIDLAELVEGEVRAVEPLADERGLRLSLHIESPGNVIEGNVVQIRRVIANLLGNALKFTPPGGTIQCQVSQDHGWVSMAVCDTGRGIERTVLDRVFDAFRQGPGQRRQRGAGVGLGLAVVRQLVELHGGTVTAASAGPGCGATFTVRLPVAAPAATASDAPVACFGT